MKLYQWLRKRLIFTLKKKRKELTEELELKEIEKL